MREIIIHKTIAQTIGSQFPRVPMVKVNGLKNQAATAYKHKLSGTFRSFKMEYIKKPTSKSAKQAHNINDIANYMKIHFINLFWKTGKKKKNDLLILHNRLYH